MTGGSGRFCFGCLLVASLTSYAASTAGAQATSSTSVGQASVSSGQAWPTRPVRVIVPITAGSATDVIARIASERLAAQLGQNFVIDNRPGASGTIGTSAAAKAEAD